MNLTEFLLARFAEDEALARLIPDEMIEHRGDCQGTLCEECGHCCHSSEDCDHDCGGLGGGCRDAVSELPWAHRRVLAEVEAKRRIVEDFETLHADYQVTHDRTTEARRFQVAISMGHLATVYADHPDYQQEWRP